MDIDLIISFISLVIITLAMYLLNTRKMNYLLGKKLKKKKKEVNIMEIRYFEARFNLDRSKLLNKKIIFIISLIDAFIICITFYVIMKLPLKIMWQLLIGFVLLFGLIYSIYEIVGRVLVKKGYKK